METAGIPSVALLQIIDLCCMRLWPMNENRFLWNYGMFVYTFSRGDLFLHLLSFSWNQQCWQHVMALCDVIGDNSDQ